ncbi:MAG: hypothetical protein JNL80_00450 [Phycisphaerae bacterium]|jgi:hypothetical protein|nr:hypothetical protein [Phycisphaerae bacterium]
MTHVRDEGPSDDDLRRFGSEVAYCPDCGAEVWDQADVCPTCFAYLGGDTSRRRGQRHRRWRTAVILIILASIAVSWVGIHYLLQMFR